jgi:putative flippase GtrA
VTGVGTRLRAVGAMAAIGRLRWDLWRTDSGRRAMLFALVGLINLVVDVAIFNALLLTIDKPLTSKFLASSVALIASYYMNRHWTWRDRRRPAGAREPLLFFGLSLVGVAIAEVCLLVSHYGLQLTSRWADNFSANVVGLALAMVWRFWSYNRWVFTDDRVEPPVPAAPQTLVLPDVAGVPVAEPAP